jgi:hypothetical protein
MTCETIRPDVAKSEAFGKETKPVAGITYWVCCKGYRTRAIYTTSGKWLLPYNGKEVIDVISFFS